MLNLLNFQSNIYILYIIQYQMAKKFVKTQFNSNVKRDQRNNSSYQSKPYKKNRTIQYYQKSIVTQLRKYFQVFETDQQINNLMIKYPTFFCQLSFHPQNNKTYKGRQSGKPTYIAVQKQKFQEEQIVQWQSQGQIELGAKIDDEKIKQYENIKPIKINELKPHEIEFLEQQFRMMQQQKQRAQLQKIQQQKQLEMKKKVQQIQYIQKNQQKQEQISQIKNINNTKTQSQDQQIHIKKQIVYQTKQQQQQLINKKKQDLPHYIEDQLHIEDDDDQDDSKFKSSSSSDNDIFCSSNDQQQKILENQISLQNANHGRISYPKGQFSLFSFNLGINQDEKVWRLHNGVQEGPIKSSKQMDFQYYTILKNYIYIGFKQFEFVSYEHFRISPTIELFKAATQASHAKNQYKYNNNMKNYGNNNNNNNNNFTNNNNNNQNNNNMNRRKMSGGNYYNKNQKKQYI